MRLSRQKDRANGDWWDKGAEVRVLASLEPATTVNQPSPRFSRETSLALQSVREDGST
jgi:hypothetical protein